MAHIRPFVSIISLVIPLATAQTWHVIAPQIGTISTGVAFVNATTGYIPVDENGVGAEILKTTDGGKSWAAATTEPFELLLLDIAAYGNNVAVVGALSMEYSNDGGVTFNSSTAPFGAGQCMRVIGDDVGFAAVGQWGFVDLTNGPAVSYDAGKTFAAVNDSSLSSDSRYGAFPDAQTWYVDAGDWPGEGSTDDDPPNGLTTAASRTVNPAWYLNIVPVGSTLVRAKGARGHILRTPSGKLQWGWVRAGSLAVANGKVRSRSNGRSAQVVNWEAQIGKTQDAGKTWSLVFSKEGQFYFNGIECTSDATCCAVAEADGPPTPGTHIFCTIDGGQNWTQTYVNADADASLMDIASVSQTEYWAVGGEMGLFGPTGASFFQTLDGGLSWKQQNVTITDQYAVSIDCVYVGANCWASMLDVLTQETSIASLK